MKRPFQRRLGLGRRLASTTTIIARKQTFSTFGNGWFPDGRQCAMLAGVNFWFYSMRAPEVLLGFVLLAASPSAAVPVATRQTTGDSWEIGSRSPTAPCEHIRSEIAYPLPDSTRQTAVSMLADASLRRLDDQQASDLLQQGTAGDLFTNLLTAQVTKLQDQRNIVIRDHLGSWSDADTVTASDLVALFGPHYPPYQPYLVRGLAGPRTSSGNFIIHLCGDTLLIDNLSDGDAARRFPMIIFLQAAPAIAIPSWYR